MTDPFLFKKKLQKKGLILLYLNITQSNCIKYGTGARECDCRSKTNLNLYEVTMLNRLTTE